MSAVSLLCEIIAQGGTASSGFYSRNENVAALFRYGFLRPAGVIDSVVCEECGTPHSAQVVHTNSAYGYWCPEVAFVSLDPAHLTAFRADVPILIDRLADVFECQRRKSSGILGQTWRIGAAPTDTGSVMLYFHPTLQSDADARALQGALASEVRSEWRLVVTSRGTLPMAGLAVVQLDDLVEIDMETGSPRAIASLETLAGIPPRKNRGGRPNEHGDLLKTLINRRTAAGKVCEALNAECRAIRDAFLASYPDKPCPSDSTIKRHVREARGGS